MRVFGRYYFDLGGRVLFKDTLSYVEIWLAGQGISYNGMAFMMNLCGNSELHCRMVEKYPQLEKYQRIYTGNREITTERLYAEGELRPFEYDLSSVPQCWPEPYELHVAREDENLVRELVTKIPRPFNPGATCVVLDHVQWFSDINAEPAISDDKGEPCGFSAFPLHTNHIELVKDFQMGKKRNQVSAKIERTKSSEELLDVSHVLEKLVAAFGPVQWQCLDVVFSPEEIRENKAADEEIAPLLEALWEEMKPERTAPENAPSAYKIIRQKSGIDLVMAMEGEPVSPKKAILKAIKGTGFQYKFSPGGFYDCEKFTRYNHRIEIFFSLKPMSRHLTFGMGVRGYNFRIGIPTAPDVDIMKQSVADETAQKLVNAALQVEERLTEPLARFYGKTPDWYW